METNMPSSGVARTYPTSEAVHTGGMWRPGNSSVSERFLVGFERLLDVFVGVGGADELGFELIL